MKTVTVGRRVAPIKRAPLPFGRIERMWSGGTVVCLASGPSLTPALVEACRGTHTIAIKDSVRLAPWADVLYACDAKWWNAHQETRSFPRRKYAMEHPKDRQDLIVLKNSGFDGLDISGEGLRTGRNSGYQAINLAVMLGASRIVLLGYDMQATGGKHHWFGAHSYNTQPPPYAAFLPLFESLVGPLAALGVRVVNATPGSALRTFPRVSIDEAIGVAA